jgi:hypothetical protein
MYQIEVPEVVDIYDDLGKPIGVKPRRQVHRDGDWHFTFHCLVVSGSADSLSFVLQRRSRYVDEYPGLMTSLLVATCTLVSELPMASGSCARSSGSTSRSARSIRLAGIRSS